MRTLQQVRKISTNDDYNRTVEKVFKERLKALPFLALLLGSTFGINKYL
jgi:hypothetical protein